MICCCWRGSTPGAPSSAGPSTWPASRPRPPALAAAGRPITLEAAEPVIVDADAERLRQVIDNLIGNAIQHTPRGTPVSVNVSSEPGTGLLTVADRGPGMSREQASHVFERFYRTDDARTRARGGAGLGLAIATSLAVAHGGELTVDTQPGHGAAFHLRLPLAGTFPVIATESQGDLP